MANFTDLWDLFLTRMSSGCILQTRNTRISQESVRKAGSQPRPNQKFWEWVIAICVRWALHVILMQVHFWEPLLICRWNGMKLTMSRWMKIIVFILLSKFSLFCKWLPRVLSNFLLLLFYLCGQDWAWNPLLAWEKCWLTLLGIITKHQ